MMRASLLTCTFPLVCCCGAVTPSPVISAEPTAKELLALYDSRSRLPKRIHYRVEYASRYTGLGLPANTLSDRGVAEVWVDGNRARYSLQRAWLPVAKQDTPFVKQFNEYIYLDQGSLTIFRDPEKKTPTSVLAYLGKVPSTKRLGIAGLEFGPIHGYCPDNGGKPTAVILGESTLSVRRDTVRNIECWVLEGVGRWGQHTLWLNPARGFVPIRLRQQKMADSWFMPEKRLKSIMGPPPWRPKSAYREIVRTVEFDWSEEGPESVIPRSLTTTTSEQFANGQAVSWNSKVTVSDVTLAFDTDAPFRAGADIPNGMQVQVDDHPNIEYEWQDGKIVKKINQQVVADLEASSFVLAPWYARLPVMVGLGALVVIVSAAWWYYRFRASSPGKR